MTWNWQQKNWPNFTWNNKNLEPLEAQFLYQSGLFVGVTQHFSEPDKTLWALDLITDEALKTSEIEGEYLNRDSVQVSLRRNFGLETDHRRVPAAEKGIADLLTHLYQHYDETLSHELLFHWHTLLTQGRTDLKVVGGYRAHEDPMQVVSGAIHKPKVHFEAPPSKKMTVEMDRFIDWFVQSGPQGHSPLPLLARAGLAHLYFVSIHPFEDGNGRIARALSEKSLSEGLAKPTLIALSQTIHKRRKLYYEALEANNKALDVTPWLDYFAQAILEAQAYSQRLVNFLIEKTKLYDRIKDQLNERQAKVVTRLFREGPEGFQGGLSAENYLSITGASRATATRDLNALVELNVLTKTGELKGTRYQLNVKAS
jgi:Fic family protein